MKQCPACKTTYTDATLRYCLADGATLTDLGGTPTQAAGQGDTSAETVAMAGRGEPMRIDIPRQTTPTVPQPAYQTSPAASSGSSSILKIILVIIGLGIFVVLAAGVAGFLYYNMNRNEVVSNGPNKGLKTPNPTPTVDDKDELRNQIANLEKLLNDPKRTSQPVSPTNMPFTEITTGRVNSPNDHFLALRSLPNSQAGTRIYKIPDGEIVSIGQCSNASRLGDRTGRWCQARYKGFTGWVFDAFLDY